MNKKAILSLMLAILMPLTGYLLVKHYSKEAVHMPARYYVPDSIVSVERNGKLVTDTVWHKVKNISFTNQLGKKVSLDDLHGKIIVLDFFFTRCPSICPGLAKSMKRLQDSFKQNDSIVQFISISIDPLHDSVQQLRKFADRFNINHDTWWMVTGDKKEIYDFALNEVKANVADPGVDTAFIHTENFFLLDTNRIVRGFYNGFDSAKQATLVRDIPLLMLEKDKTSPSVLRDFIPILPMIFIAIGIVIVITLLLNRNKINKYKMLQPALQKNDKKARLLIYTVSFVVFAAVVLLSKFKLSVDLGFNVHLFAKANAIINSVVAVLLVAGLVTIKQKKQVLHKKIMLTAMVLSILFLVSYICHHLLAGDTRFGDINHDGILSDDEKLAAGSLRMVYYFILLTHIPLAAIILPFILFTAYRALIGEYEQHKKLTRITWPVWFYVAVTGVIVYVMISPYYI